MNYAFTYPPEVWPERQRFRKQFDVKDDGEVLMEFLAGQTYQWTN